jgi:hypothetical protein
MTMTKERLIDLQRTVDTLQGRVQDMQWELRHAKRPPAERWWRSLLRAKHSNTFMSACCNRRVRPNMKMVDYAAAGNQQ